MKYTKRIFLFASIAAMFLVSCTTVAEPAGIDESRQQEVVKGPEQKEPPEVLAKSPKAPNKQETESSEGKEKAQAEASAEKEKEQKDQELYNKEMEELKKQKSFYRGSQYSKKIALTFDDGPDRHFTLQVLDILKREQVPATFFVVGNMTKANPDILKRIDQEGHIIGNHSYSHPQMTKISTISAMTQIDKTNKLIEQTIGKEPALFRPPYGAFNKSLTNEVAKKGMKVIYWDVDTLDWNRRSSQEIFGTIRTHAKGGSIILQHSAGNDGLAETVKALPQVINHYKAQGYEFVTVDELLEIPAYK